MIIEVDYKDKNGNSIQIGDTLLFYDWYKDEDKLLGESKILFDKTIGKLYIYPFIKYLDDDELIKSFPYAEIKISEHSIV